MGDARRDLKEGAALVQLARYHVAESPTWATPAVVGRRILVKDATSLAEWGVPGQETMDDGRWTMDGGRQTMDDGRWTMDGGRWTVDVRR